MSNNLTFINKNLNTYLKGMLKKFDFTDDDLEHLESLNISAFDMGDNFLSNSLEDLKKFPNLKTLEISRYILNRENIDIIEKLSKLENYTFKYTDIKDKCNIFGKNITLINCQKIYNINFEFDNIVIENGDLKELNFDCKKISLSYCTNFEKCNIQANEIEFKRMELNDIEKIKRLAENSKIIINNCTYPEGVFDNIKNIKILKGVEGENIG